MAALAACSLPGLESGSRGEGGTARPERFTIVPDDYHVPYAGTAQDGRKFFLSDELFDLESEEGTGFVGLFLWKSDGTYAEIRVDAIPRAEDIPPGQAASSGAKDLVEKRLQELGDYTLEAITVEPFLETVDGVAFGWAITEFDGQYSINIEPGNFIAYYEPWDGLGYDT